MVGHDGDLLAGKPILSSFGQIVCMFLRRQIILLRADSSRPLSRGTTLFLYAMFLKIIVLFMLNSYTARFIRVVFIVFTEFYTSHYCLSPQCCEHSMKKCQPLTATFRSSPPLPPGSAHLCPHRFSYSRCVM